MKKPPILQRTGNTTEYFLFHHQDISRLSEHHDTTIKIPCEVDMNEKREVIGLRILHPNRTVRFAVRDFRILDELETAGYKIKRYGP